MSLLSSSKQHTSMQATSTPQCATLLLCFRLLCGRLRDGIWLRGPLHLIGAATADGARMLEFGQGDMYVWTASQPLG